MKGCPKARPFSGGHLPQPGAYMVKAIIVFHAYVSYLVSADLVHFPDDGEKRIIDGPLADRRGHARYAGGLRWAIIASKKYPLVIMRPVVACKKIEERIMHAYRPMARHA